MTTPLTGKYGERDWVYIGVGGSVKE